MAPRSQHPRARRPSRSGGLRSLGRVRQRAGQPGAMAAVAAAAGARGALRGLAALRGRGASRAAMVSAAGAESGPSAGWGRLRAQARGSHAPTRRSAVHTPSPLRRAGRGRRTRGSSRPATARWGHLLQNTTPQATSVVVYELAHRKQSRLKKKKI